ncbi:MAG: restriction endonuclease subunit S [Acholeplasmataceae bacterium]|nr:restriction endonuclease subunit S [Acholeplasmataceae bacterium]
MSKLEDLIAELCPNGVPFKPLAELGKFFGGITGKSKDDFTNGNAAFITYKNVYSNPALNINPDDTVKITEEEKQRTLEYGDVIFTGSSETPDECGISSVVTKKPEKPLYLNSFCFFFRFNDLNIIEPDFAKHLFRSTKLRYQIGKTASGVTRFNVSKKLMEKVVIPVPPLPVQREIVRILDNFTELTARKKQYEYYRDSLLTFGDEVPRVTLEKLFNIRNGYTPSKANNEYWENGTVPWFRMEDIRDNGRILSDAIQNVSDKAIKGRAFAANSFIVATSATIGEHALITRDFLANQRFTVLTVKNEYAKSLNIKYFYYYCFILDEWCKDNLTVGHFASVDMGRFKKFEVPLPPLEEQARIVAILDKFDVLTTDISFGLPAEIEARQKQYEYYRDRLLTFKELS